jgi:hypothetical protein
VPKLKNKWCKIVLFFSFFHASSEREGRALGRAYYVPTTRLVISRDRSPPNNLANPKSEILGV